jgi:hypothetical protein
VYIIGPDGGGRPVKIGYAHDPKHALRNKKLDSDQPLQIEVLWTTDITLASRIVSRCRQILAKAKKELPDGWYDIDAEWAKKVIGVAAGEGRIPIYTNAQARRRAEADQDRETKKLMRMLDWWDERRLKRASCD